MTLVRTLGTVALSVALSWGVFHYTSDKSTDTTRETRMERIKRTGVLTCGYYVWPPVIAKDPNTGKMSGLVVDFIETVGKQLNLKIDWAVEMTPAGLASDLATGRYDMACAPFFVVPSRLREMDFTTPFMYHPAYLYAREGDKRFDNNYAAANDPSVKFSTIDGEFSAVAAEENFPKASRVTLPQNAQGPEMLLNVASKKADVVVTEPTTFATYNKNNPGVLRRVAGAPVRVMAVGFPIPLKEQDMKNTFDQTFAYLKSVGLLDTILAKYETDDVKYLRLPQPYELSGEGKP